MLLIKRQRLLRELSQKRLAAITSCLSQADISRMESGLLLPTDKQRKALAIVLGIAPERLLEHVEDPNDGSEYLDSVRS